MMPKTYNHREQKLVRRYGINEQQFDSIKESQGGGCALCGNTDDQLVVDHCHEKGYIRGLLCHQCNIGLGMFRDNPSTLRRAIGYVNNARVG
jgi:hypothetical protein